MDTIKNWMCRYGMNSSASGQGPMALCPEEANESSGSIQRLQFLTSRVTIEFPERILLRAVSLHMKGKQTVWSLLRSVEYSMEYIGKSTVRNSNNRLTCKQSTKD